MQKSVFLLQKVIKCVHFVEKGSLLVHGYGLRVHGQGCLIKRLKGGPYMCMWFTDNRQRRGNQKCGP